MMHPGPGRLESNVRKALCSQSCTPLLELEPNQSVNTWRAPGANLQFLPNSKMSVYVQRHQPLNQTKSKSLLLYSSTRRELYWDDISQFTDGWMIRVIYGNLNIWIPGGTWMPRRLILRASYDGVIKKGGASSQWKHSRCMWGKTWMNVESREYGVNIMNNSVINI